LLCLLLLSILFTSTMPGYQQNTSGLRRCKAGAWKKENTVEAVTCWNLEHILDAEQHGQPMPEELTMDDLVGEDVMYSK
jgi:hypothetical protein